MNLTTHTPGVHRTSDGVSYGVWAPACQRVEVELFQADGELLRRMPMERHSNGYFSGFDAMGHGGDLYKFRLDEGQSFPDPASRWQPQGVHGPSMVIDPNEYSWGDAAWVRPAMRDVVIYELHVGTFTAEGTFRSAIARLGDLKALGVNAIELMPIGDFDGGRNWGYDGVCLYAPARCYGDPEGLRALVDAAHQAGIAVILDVVYNHFGPAGNYLAAFLGDYLDEELKTPWGGAIRYADPAFAPLRSMVGENPAYWMREFHFDGFRLDATHAITDASPRHLLKEIAAGIHARGGWVIAEDARNDATLLTREEDGGFGFDGVWADDFHHVVRVTSTHENESYLANYRGSVVELVETLRHGWLFRGQDWIVGSPTDPGFVEPRGTDCREIPPERFVHCVSNHDQIGNHAFGERTAPNHPQEALRTSAVLLCLSPYTPMLFMGQEWCASTPFLFFTDHEESLGKLITLGRREEFKGFAAFQNPATLAMIPDPQAPATFAASKLNWAEPEQEPHAGILRLYKACLALRAAEPAFRPRSRESWDVNVIGSGLGALQFRSGASVWLVLFDLAGGNEGSWKQWTGGETLGAATWQQALSTDEARFGGGQENEVDLRSMHVRFNVPGAVVLKR